MNNRTVKSSSVRILLALTTAAVVFGAILFAAAPPCVALGQNGERPSSSVQPLVAPAPLVPDSSWTGATPHPTLIARYAFAQFGQDLYVISGAAPGFNTVTTVRRYSATTNVWTSRADIPVGSQGAPGAYSGGRIFVPDGRGGVNLIRIYNIAANAWSAGPARPGVTSSYGAAAGAFNGNIYVAGGGTSAAGSSILSIYNIASNTWSAGPDAPSPYSLGGYTQIGRYLYLIGSFTSEDAVNSSVSMRLDMETNTWSTGPVWTPQRADFALAAAGTRLFAIGGDSNGGGSFDPSAQVDELETSTWPSGAWIPSPDNLPVASQGNSASFFSTGRAGGEIWSTGGIAAGSVFLKNHLFRPVYGPCEDYDITQSTRGYQGGGTDTGNHCDDCITPITLPFPVSFYGQTYTSANVSDNGNLQFGGENFLSFTNTNLPAADFNATIFAFWDDLTTDSPGDGIFTFVFGTAPNRFLNIEWRVTQPPFVGTGKAVFEIKFFEGSPVFEVVYGGRTGTFTGTVGVQQSSTSCFTQNRGPNANVPAANTRLLFTTGCPPIAFNGSIGQNSITYPGSSGFQQGRLTRNGVQSMCGTAKPYPGTFDTTQRTADVYSFNNAGPAACVTFSVNTACIGATDVFLVAYLNSYSSGNIAANYLGDPGESPDPFRSFSVDVPANSTAFLVVHEVQPQSSCNSYDVVVSGLSCVPLALTTAVSRKTHGAAGVFDIPLPLTGEPAVECRTSSGGNYTLVFTFNFAVTSGNAAVTAGIGSAGPPTFSGTTMAVSLSGVTDIQQITLTLSGVTSGSLVLPNTAVSMNVLLGDTTGNKTVNASDIGQTKGQSGLAVSAANFRNDTTVSGSINAADIGQVKANSGHSVP